MENNEKLNSLVIRYQHGDGEAFRELYDSLSPMRSRWLAKATGRYLDDRATREAQFGDTLWKCAANFDAAKSTDFIRHFISNLRHANVTGLRRRTSKSLSMEVPDRQIDEDGTLLTELIADANPLPDEIVQKKRDHRQVISILLADQSEVVKKIAIDRPMYNSDLELAKALGVHHTAVKRTWNKLAARYDANRFGPISQYLA